MHRDVFAKLEAVARERNVSISSIVERAVAGALGTTPPAAREYRTRRSKT